MFASMIPERGPIRAAARADSSSRWYRRVRRRMVEGKTMTLYQIAALAILALVVLFLLLRPKKGAERDARAARMLEQDRERQTIEQIQENLRRAAEEERRASRRLQDPPSGD